MDKQPMTMKLADALEEYSNRDDIADGWEYKFRDAAVELRCLHIVNTQLLKALEMAKEHLEYCGYGDSWERECALTGEDPLDKKIDAAIAAAKGEI